MAKKTKQDRIIELLVQSLKVQREILRRTKSLDRKYEVAIKVGAGLMLMADVESALQRINDKARQEDVVQVG